MSALGRYLLPALVILGLILAGRGAMLYYQADSSGAIQNWVTPSSSIPGNAYMWTWGFDGSPNNEPDIWHFHVFFKANDTAEVLLLWNLNETVLFQKMDSRFDEAFDVPLPRTNQAWRWDWLISNPHSSGISVENFTISHFSIRYPERLNGTIAMGAGAIMLIVAISLLFHSRRRRTPQTQQNSSQA